MGFLGGGLGCLDMLPPPRFVQYKATSLEKQHKHDLLTEPDLGVTIDLINPDTYRIDPSGGKGGSTPQFRGVTQIWGGEVTGGERRGAHPPPGLRDTPGSSLRG